MLTDLLSRAIASASRKAAIVQGPRRIRYDELGELAGRAAGGLRRLGVEAGDCVAVVLPNGPEFVAALFACARLRAVMLPLDPRSTRDELLRFLADARARVVIADPPRGSLLATAGAVVTDFGSLLAHPMVPGPADRFGGRALYLYTSGSTDAAKRLCCTQENLVHEARNFVETVGLTAEDHILCAIPLHHSYGLGNGLLDAAYTGATLVLTEQDDAPFVARCRRLPGLIREERITFFPGVPYQFQILAAHPDLRRDDLAGLRLCTSSADVLPRRTYERFLERFGLPIRSLYGSTEAGSISLDMDPVGALQFGSLGPPLKNVEVRVRDESGRDLPANESGQIWVKSPVIPPTGYENRPGLTAEAFRDGFYNTGDLGKLDDRGHLIMTGRKQTFVDVGGNKVDVGEVEEVLLGHPNVREAAVLGVEAPNLGTLIKAVVVTDGAPDEADILSHCRRRLAAFKVPRLVGFRDALPRGATGKVLKSELGDLGAFLARSTPVDREPTTPGMERLAVQIQEQAALCLQHERDSLSRSASFQSMGFDSLRAAELHLRLVELTGLPLSITVLWNYPTIDRLAAALWGRMNEGPGEAPTSEPESARGARITTDLGELLNEVESLSDPEIDASFRGK
jgi:long-chain acyl-CoA synthetase